MQGKYCVLFKIGYKCCFRLNITMQHPEKMYLLDKSDCIFNSLFNSPGKLNICRETYLQRVPFVHLVTCALYYFILCSLTCRANDNTPLPPKKNKNTKQKQKQKNKQTKKKQNSKRAVALERFLVTQENRQMCQNFSHVL